MNCGAAAAEEKSDDKIVDYSGTWILKTNDNMDSYLKSIGIGMIKRKVMGALNITITIKQDGMKLDFKVAPTGQAVIETTAVVGGDPVNSINSQGNPLQRTFTKNEKGFVVVSSKINTKDKKTTGDCWNPKRAEERVWKLEGNKLTFLITNKDSGEKMSQVYEKKE